MCGIAGFISPALPCGSGRAVLQGMLEAIVHRGPDAGGVWKDERHGIALGHRRLSILDLSLAGHQPMESACGRYVIVFNGEIYNHLDLREALERAAQLPPGGWRGHSDT